MPKRLVIVESPAKARTIAGYLGPDFIVESSVGHIRDLPDSAAEIPEKYKGESWARLGVDVEHEFEPLYVVDPDKKKTVAQLRKQLADADELLLATDEDREGEAIAWHLLEVLKPKVPARRMVFHEITRDAIERALDETREVDERLVDAQESRRILDRLYGYEVSPVLWKKVMRGLSAGRVQSVATRLVVERERERMAFRAAAWWDLLGTFDPDSFEARLVSVEGQRVATGRDFGPDGKLRGEARQLDEEAARGLADRLRDASFQVSRVERKPYVRRPSPPFMTSTLQQEASRKLRFSAQTTMRLAQRLYENGYITYMRTDSTTLSESALTAARAQATSLFGADYVPPEPRRYERKVKNAQEAHEAIRPSGDQFRTPPDVRSEVSQDEYALYELIWMRTIASQMKDAQGQTVSLRIAAESSANEAVEFGASGTVITFRGFLAAYEEGRDADRSAQEDEEERRLPNLAEGDSVELRALEPQGHETSPPARYTEATLVRTLEELGIGRPSTYASILGTILDRGYVFKRGTALVPAFLAFSVVGLLEQHFGQLVDYDFTARMEDDLDRIAAGDEHRVKWLGRFYFGDGPAGAEGGGVARPGAAGSAGGTSSPGLHELVSDLSAIDAREINSLEIGDGIVLRVGRYGPYLERDGQRASVPEELAPDELTLERAEELLSQPTGDRELGTDPETGRPIVARTGRYGPYVTEVLPDDAKEKPQTASLFKTMSLDTITLEDALRLLEIPRVVGVAPGGEEIVARNGRYGPYIQQGKESRSLETEEQLFTIDLPGALALLAQPRQRRGQRASAAPLRELGTDPVGGKEIVLKEGRFGPYVTDGETNASLRKGDDPESVTLDRALELLAERRAKGPAKRSPRRRKAS
ncbi:MAG TPA: type I DNA topoisomerase [Gaiellaceae bacterium]|nr:type I DNA topoisomerase [Gaiellaceae bacterium]